VRHVEPAGGTSLEIAATADRFAAALARGDSAEAAAVYVEDAIVLPPSGNVISGRDAIERFWLSGIEIGLDAVELEPLGRGNANSIVYEHGRYRIVLAPDGGRLQEQRGAYVVVHVQAAEDSSWRWAVGAFGDPRQEEEA
jgi:uncharacterized protein (TIGR02246 family)